MIIGSIKEIKNNENRVGLTPEITKKLTQDGHNVIIEKSAGSNAGFTDQDYTDAGAKVMDDPVDIAKEIDILVKVKEPLESEFPVLQALKGKTLYTYLHLAAAPKELTLELIKNNITGIAYETVEDENKRLPLLTPMSEVAGVLAIQYGGQYLQKKYNGRGVSLGVITGTTPANVVVIGGGVVGSKSAITAAGLGCKVSILEKNPKRIEELKEEYSAYLGKNLFDNVSFVESTNESLIEEVKKADLLVGAVLIPGAKAPEIVKKEHIELMKKGSVVVDVAIDQGGCIHGSKPTSHDDPIYTYLDKIYCCITNMPGQVALQSTQALTEATYPFLKQMANNGIMETIKSDEGFAKGVNTYDGKLVLEEVAEALDLEYTAM